MEFPGLANGPPHDWLFNARLAGQIVDGANLLSRPDEPVSTDLPQDWTLPTVVIRPEQEFHADPDYAFDAIRHHLWRKPCVEWERARSAFGSLIQEHFDPTSAAPAIIYAAPFRPSIWDTAAAFKAKVLISGEVELEAPDFLNPALQTPYLGVGVGKLPLGELFPLSSNDERSNLTIAVVEEMGVVRFADGREDIVRGMVMCRACEDDRALLKRKRWVPALRNWYDRPFSRYLGVPQITLVRLQFRGLAEPRGLFDDRWFSTVDCYVNSITLSLHPQHARALRWVAQESSLANLLFSELVLWQLLAQRKVVIPRTNCSSRGRL